MSKHTLEQVLEALINKEEDRASDLLHQFFVQKGKSIYEELSSLDEVVEEDDEEEVEESIGGSQSDDFEDEIIATEEDLEDERLFSEDDDMGGEDPMSAEEPSEDEATAELAFDGDIDAEGETAEPAEEKADEAMARVDDALAELKAAFAEIMGGEATDEEMPEMEMEEDFDALGESASLSAVASPSHGDDGQNTKSPVSSGAKIDNGAKAVAVKDGNTAGGKSAAPSTSNAGNVNVPGNKKAPAMRNVAVPKGSDSASNKTSPVAKA